MSSDFTVSDKRKLVDLARAIVERARLAGPPEETRQPEQDGGALPTLAMHEELSPKAVAEFAASCRQQVETVNRRVTQQLDAMLLILERFEIQVTGDPDVALIVKGLQPDSIAEGLQKNPGVVATANHCVHAIPYVCRAEAGIKTYLDLPMIVGRPAPKLAGAVR